MPGATPDTVLTTRVGSSCRAVSAMMKFLPAKKMKLPKTSTLSTSGSTTRPERPFDFPQSGQIAVKKIGHQSDDVDDERAVFSSQGSPRPSYW